MLIKESAQCPETEVPELAAAQDEADAAEEKRFELPEHIVEWIDFGTMGSLSKKQRHNDGGHPVPKLQKEAYISNLRRLFTDNEKRTEQRVFDGFAGGIALGDDWSFCDPAV